MNSNITVKGKAYVENFRDESRSRRTSITDGNAFPHTIEVAHQQLTDGKTKLPMVQSKLFVAMSHKDTGGVNPAAAPVSVQLTVRKGTGVNAPTTAELLLAIDSVRQILASTAADASALDQSTDLFVNLAQ